MVIRLINILIVTVAVTSNIEDYCKNGSCFPVIGDLLTGREDYLFASSTCGINKPERYCDHPDLSVPKRCYWCDSRNQTDRFLNHRIHEVINKYFGLRKSWWQSESGKENVSIQLDLEAKFQLQQLMIKFKTLQPKALLVERSSNFGRTWQVYRYFSFNCSEDFPGIPAKTQMDLTEVVCENQYSRLVNGVELNYKLLPHNFNPYFEEAQSFLSATNLRINLTKFHHHPYLQDNQSSSQENYYYAIEKIVVLGSCSCNGHAARCLPMSDDVIRSTMVHGRCKCAHNTRGLNCEFCDNLFNNLPWRPAAGNSTNACKRCTCDSRVTKCHFDYLAYENSGRIQGGVCDI